MICHVCEQQAIGQCKKCGKFYCKEHGDVTCVVCDQALQGSPSPHPESGIDVRLPEYGGPRAAAPVYGGPTCYKCSERPIAACAKCGVFYCSWHRGGTSFFDNTRGGWFQEGRVLCQDCLKSVNQTGVVGCMIALLVLAFMALVFFGFAAH
jgi:hypothetical protein